MLKRRERLSSAIVRQSLAAPWLTIVAWLLLCAAAAPFAAAVKIETTVESILDRDSEEWAFYQDAQYEFGGDEMLVVAARAASPWDPKLLDGMEQLAGALSEIKGIRRVDSLSTTPLLALRDDGSLDLSPAHSADATVGPELIRRANEDKFARDNLLSRDGRMHAVNVLYEPGEYGSEDTLTSLIDESGIGSRVYVSGVPVFRWNTNRQTVHELMTLGPIAAAVLIVLLAALLGSVRTALKLVLASTIPTVLTVAAMGATGTPFTISTLILPVLLLGLASAYSMHVVAASWRPGTDLCTKVCDVSFPVLLSGVTTALGFLAIATVRIDAIREIASFGALGTAVATGVSLSLVPAILQLSAPVTASPPAAGFAMRRILDPAWRFAAAHTKRILVVAAVSLTAASILAFGLTVDTDVIRWFPEDHRIRQDYREIRESIAGITPVNFVVQLPRNSALDIDTVQALLEFEQATELEGDVGSVISIARPVCQLAASLRGESGCVLPDSDEELAQLLLALESIPMVQDLINDSGNRLNIPARLDTNSSSEIITLTASLEGLAQELIPGAEVQATGVMYEFARSQEAISWGQIQGVALASVVIWMALAIGISDPKLALLAMVPNLGPIIICLGAMSAFGIPIDAGTVLIGNLALGIAVDDTAHLLAPRTQGALGPPVLDSASFSHVGVPIAFSTAVLAAAFFVLGTSGFVFIQHLGVITGLVLITCFLADLLVLPALARFPK